MANEPQSEHISSSPDSERTTIDFSRPNTLVGQCLDGRFFIEKNLTDAGGDSGGIGVVYLAKDTKLMGKDVVVKILNETALQHPDIVRKFHHEKEALIRLDHPGVVRIVDSGTLLDGNPFMVMDYIQGHSLRKALDMSGRLPLGVAAHIIESVSDALSAAHEQNILHRDIKPENIMLTPSSDGLYRVRIIDFGIARVGDSKLAPATEISRAIGSILYIAPEQLIGRLDLTASADIYSLAILIYEMLTGEPPFKPKAIAEMYQLQKEGVKTLPSELRPEIPRQAETILMSALEFDPEKRPQIARPFGRYLAHELISELNASDRFFASVQTEWAEVPSDREIIDQTESLTVERPASTELSVAAAADDDGPKRPFWAKWILGGAGLVALLSIPVIYVMWTILSNPSSRDAAANSVTMAAGPADVNQISYHLNVQKMRDGKPFEEPFRSSGQEIFESGYKFRLVVETSKAGELYIFNEGKTESGTRIFSLLFPTPRANDGRPEVMPGQVVETNSNKFTGGRGTEIMWLIWSRSPQSGVRDLVTAAASGDGTVSDPKAILDLISQYQHVTRDVSKDAESQSTLVKAGGDVVVQRVELEHR